MATLMAQVCTTSVSHTVASMLYSKLDSNLSVQCTTLAVAAQKSMVYPGKATSNASRRIMKGLCHATMYSTHPLSLPIAHIRLTC
jgi:hypothetical protein